MAMNLTFHLGVPQSNLTRVRAGDLDWLHSEKIAALGKRADKAGNRHGSDLGVRLTN
jgi:hypothetical protein